MKKLSIFLLGAMAIAATSCEDGPSVTPVQSNPQGPVLEVDGIYAEQNPEAAVVNLPELAEAGRSIPLANFQVASLPEGYSLKLVAELSKTEAFTKSAELPIEYSENIAWVNPDNFQNVYVTTVSKSPAANNAYVRFAPYAVKGNEELRIGGMDNYIGPFMMNVTPFPSELVLEQNYYLVGTVNGWDVATALKFNHSDESPYDDPIYTIVVDITPDQADSGWWWKILPESTVEAGNWVDAANSSFGPEENGSEDMEGMLFASKMDEEGNYVDSQAGCLYEYGTYMLTLDMIEGTYKFTLAVPHLYIMGDAAGWNWDSPLVAEMQTSDYTNYYAFARLSEGGYKFTSDKDWSATFNLGLDNAEISNHNIEGKLLNGSSNNIMPDITGLFWNHVNLPALSFDSYYIATLGVIGDCTPNGWDASTALTPSADGLVWEGDVEFGASGSFKIRANDDWAFSLGGDMSNLGWDNAPNINTPGAGVKHVVLNLSQYPYTLTIQ